MDEQPQDQTYTEAQIKAAARAMRQVYVALINEGFTADEALILVRALMPHPQ